MPEAGDVAVLIPEDYSCAPRALEGRNILVTGATAGIGRAAALAYAEHGATVLLLGRSEERLAEVYDAIEAQGAAQPAAIPFDLARDDEGGFLNLADVIGEQFDHLDGLLLNAGILGERRPLAQASWSRFQEVMQVNVNSQFLMLKALMPLLEAAPAASVVFTSSGVGRRGRAYWGAYAVSKFATEGLMQVAAAETENTTSLRVNALNPRATNTAMRRSAFPGEEPQSNPDPQALMRAYLYLMDDASRAVSGVSFDAR
jgi:NAD(P)-dependent dehydrogenase (short-subunit alcohol dehydrogenase family)